MKTYEIKYEPIIIEGKKIDKYNIYYYIDGVEYTREFHSTDGINGTIRDGWRNDVDINSLTDEQLLKLKQRLGL